MVRPKDDPKLRPKDQPDSYRFNPRLPKFGVVIKMHKGGDQRFLARSGTVSTTQLSIWITRALTAMTTVSENLWRDTFSSVGIYTPRSWLAINSRAVRRQMSRMDAMKLRPPEAGQQTYDCSKMYTSIRLPELKDKMDKYIDMVFEYQRQAAKPYGQAKHLKIHFSKRHTTLEKQWVSSESAAQYNDSVTTKWVDADRIKVWLHFLLDNLYVQAGDQLKQQVIGIPMGTNCSPILANLLLFMYELEWVIEFIDDNSFVFDGGRSLLLPEEHRAFLTKLSCCTRYIDDLWNPLIPRDGQDGFSQILEGMYPPWLELGEPEQQERQVHFLDLNIWHDGTVWQSKLYDKRIKLEAMGLKLNKFPHVESKLVIKCKYGIITSQLFRYANACTRTKDFLHASADLYAIFIKKEYNPKIMDRFFSNWVRRNSGDLQLDLTHANCIAQFYKSRVHAARHGRSQHRNQQ